MVFTLITLFKFITPTLTKTQSIIKRRQHRTTSLEAQHDARLILLRTKEARLTRIGLGIVSLYVLCHIWRLVPTIYELIYGSENHPIWYKHMTGFSHNMIVLNSAINFLLYLVL